MRRSLLKTVIVTNIAFIMIPTSLTSYFAISYFLKTAIAEKEAADHYAAMSVLTAAESRIQNIGQITISLIASEPIRDFAKRGGAATAGEASREAYAKALDTLDVFAYQEKAIDGLSVIAADGRSVTTGTYSGVTFTDRERESADALNGGWYWELTEGRIYFIRLIRDLYDVSRRLGYIKLSIDPKELGRLLVPPYRSEDLGFALIGADGGLIVHDWSAYQLKAYREASEEGSLFGAEDQASRRAGKGRDACIITSIRMRSGNTYLVGVGKDLAGSFLLRYNLIIGLAALLSVAFSACHVAIYQLLIFKPLKHLQGLMESIEGEDFTARFDLRVSDEISQLVSSFNRMSGKLRFLHEEVYKSSLRLKDAEIKALQAEINPHFLFNTLDTIYWTISLGKAEEAGNMVRRLSSLFRISLSEATDGLIPLDRELEHVGCYLALQKERYGGRLRYTIDKPDDLGSPMVLKLALQPIVENAVIHGIGPRGEGEVIVAAERREGSLIYTVYDDGAGINPEMVENMLRGGHPEGSESGIALLNINERIKMRFGDGYGIACRSPSDGGCVFIVRQPIVEGGDDE
jgi:two-component system, sensor histidine kinase YesM